MRSDRDSTLIDTIAVTLADNLGYDVSDVACGHTPGAIIIPAHPSDHDAGRNVFSMEASFDIINDHNIVGKIIPKIACATETDGDKITVTCSKSGDSLTMHGDTWPLAYIGVYLHQQGVKSIKDFLKFN